MSSKYIISKSEPLCGEITISGAKNAALPLIAATLLASEECTLHHVPDLLDIQNLCSILNLLHAQINISNNTVKIRANKLKNDLSTYEEVTKMRASFLVAGPLLARTGRVKIPLPGGCKIGARPIDLHIKGFAALGAKVTQGFGYVEIRCKKLVGSTIYLDFPSVGATENIIMAAALAVGETVLQNAATEPEIIDLADFINKMGGKVIDAGKDTIRIIGVPSLMGCTHTVIPDRIEAGTYISAITATRGKARINNICTEHLKPITAKLKEVGADIYEGVDYLIIDASEKLAATDIKTLPFPGFPTDLQAPFAALMCVSSGTSMIVETIFENRFMHIPELVRMGAQAKVEGHTAVIEGKRKLMGASVKATDLRAGAALTIAGLVAEGQTEVSGVSHISRGYENFVEKMNTLGAKMELK